jgi:hypothetical protein
VSPRAYCRTEYSRRRVSASIQIRKAPNYKISNV